MNPALEEIALSSVQRPAAIAEVIDFSKVRIDAPTRGTSVREPTPSYRSAPFKRDYLEREAQNRSLGLAGEEFVLTFERWRLVHTGAGQLADRVVHVSRTKGDGLGYDILSFEPDGTERFVEVKTTSFGERTPFFVSANEVRFAREHAPQFQLYRVFDFRREPRLFELRGPVEQHCHLDATNFLASFG